MSNYERIINLPHYELKYHKKMSIESRAAQFSPYAALTGYDDNIKNAGRITSKEKTLSDDEKEIINMKLQVINENQNDLPITVLYYDSENKIYKEYTGTIKKIDSIKKIIKFNDKKAINFDDIYDINIKNNSI